MTNLEDKLAKDVSVFGEEIIKQSILRTFPQRIWSAWKVLCGKAGIILVRVNPKDIYK